MTERAYRLLIGISLLVFLYFQWTPAIYTTLALLVFEGLTNLRVPILVSRLRFAGVPIDVTEGENPVARFNYEAERMLRWVVFLIIGISCLPYTSDYWFIAWFVGLFLILAGITGICPMVMLLRNLGLK